MVSAVDDGVGQVLATLRTHGLEENTMVVFLSDNGGPTDDNASDNHPLRGTKGSPWEGGFRVPFAMQWPERIPKGIVYQNPVIALDLFATIAGQAKIPPNPERPLDGVNLIPFLAGEKSGVPHDEIFLRMFDKGAYAVRSGNLKLVIEARDSAPKLYDLSKDIGEKTNLAASRAADAAALEKKRAGWDAQLIPPVFEGLKMKKPGKVEGK
jgi:arylsulfatase A-like enzyme